MRRILYTVFLLVIVATSSFLIYSKRENYIALYNSLDPCKRPIEYKVGSVDTRFGLNMADVIEYSNDAAEIWNERWDGDLFIYNANAELTINMVFDERQQASNEITVLDENIDVERNKLDAMIQQHRSDVADFKKRLAIHNATVESWNKQGGAPEDEYKKLTDTQNELEAEAESLNEQAKQLNVATEDYNLQVGDLNKAIANFNEDLDAKPEEGLYIGDENRIEIYFNNNRDELIHTIAHELGHARGVDHNNNAKSVMYPYSTKVVTLSDNDIESLVGVCRQRTPLELVSARLSL